MTRLQFRSRLAQRQRWLCLAVLTVTLVACAGRLRDEAAGADYLPDANYHLLMAEIALQRKEYLTASEQYVNAALLSDDPDAARRATEFAGDYGYDNLTLNAARRWVELEPDNRAAREYAGRLYLRRYDTNRAYIHLSALPGDPPDDRDFIGLGEALAGEGNASGVTAVFKRLALQYPDSAGLQLALARTAMRSGDYDLALLAAGKAKQARGLISSERDSVWLEPHFLMAQALMAQGSAFEALALIEGLREESGSVAVELESVRLLAASGRLAQANERLANLAREYGMQPDFVRIHALINLAAGELDLAERNFENLLSAGQNVYESMYYLGRISILRGAQRDGIDYFARIRGGAYLLPAQLAEARAYQELEEPQAGLERLEAFGQDYPRHALALEPTRAQLLFDAGERQQALDALEELLSLKPDSVELLLTFGTLLDMAGELDRALTVMRRAVELAPMNANVLNTLGYTLANRNRRHEEAYRLIRQAIELDPDSPAIIDSMGWALYRLGRYDEARSYLELAYSLLEDPEVIAHLAELLWMTGEHDNARVLLERSLAEFPGHELLLGAQARLLR